MNACSRNWPSKPFPKVGPVFVKEYWFRLQNRTRLVIQSDDSFLDSVLFLYNLYYERKKIPQYGDLLSSVTFQFWFRTAKLEEKLITQKVP